MSTEHTHNDGSNDGLNDASQIPAHLQEFIDLSEALEQTMKTKDAVQITMARNKLRFQFAMLDDAQREVIQRFIQNELTGMRVGDERSTANSAAHRILNAPVLGMRALAATVPQFTGATLELVVTTLGLGIHGVVRGVQKTYRTFNPAQTSKKSNKTA